MAKQDTGVSGCPTSFDGTIDLSGDGLSVDRRTLTPFMLAWDFGEEQAKTSGKLERKAKRSW